MPAAASDRRPRWWRAALVVGGCVLLLATAVLGYLRYHVPEERRELDAYFRHTFPTIHAQTKSIQAGIAGLVDEGAPSPEMAATILEENVLPSIELVLEQCGNVSMTTVEARALHEGYVGAVKGMRDDARALRQIFGDASLTPAEKRVRAHRVVLDVGKRFDGFYARAVEVLRSNGIRVEGLAAPADAG